MLAVNFFGHSIKEFFMDQWSVFDLVVVTVSVVSLMPFFNTPGANAVSPFFFESVRNSQQGVVGREESLNYRSH